MGGRVDNPRMRMQYQPAGLRRRLSSGRADMPWAQVLAPFALGLAGVLVLVLDGHGVSWLAGMIAGGAGGAWIALRGSTGRAVTRLPAAARAERRTESAVKAMGGSGWRFLHDVRGSDRTYDHVAVGPGGVILLQSLTPSGVVTMRSGEPFAERRRDHDAEKPELVRVRPRALTDATAFRDDIERLTGRRMWVQAMVVFWAEFPAGCVTDGRCVYIHGSRLVAWLTRRPHQLDPAQIDEVFDSVVQLAQSGGEVSLQVAV
jgi:hypothetical protein